MPRQLVTQVEIDFGPLPTRKKKFTIVDDYVHARSIIQATQSGEAPTGRSADENEMDHLTCSGVPGTGQFVLIVGSLEGPVTGKYKINYMVI